MLDLYLPGLKPDSDCLNLVGNGSGSDLDSQFAKQDWIRTQKNQSPNTSNDKLSTKKNRPGFWEVPVSSEISDFTPSHHVRMHRATFYIPNPLIKLIIRA